MLTGSNWFSHKKWNTHTIIKVIYTEPTIFFFSPLTQLCKNQVNLSLQYWATSGGSEIRNDIKDGLRHNSIALQHYINHSEIIRYTHSLSVTCLISSSDSVSSSVSVRTAALVMLRERGISSDCIRLSQPEWANTHLHCLTATGNHTWRQIEASVLKDRK